MGKLFVSATEERLLLDKDSGVLLVGPVLFLCSFLFQAFWTGKIHPFDESDFEKGEIRFFELLKSAEYQNLLPDLTPEMLKCEMDFTPMASITGSKATPSDLQRELHALLLAVHQWLFKKERLSPYLGLLFGGARDVLPSNPDSWHYFYQRLRQTPAYPDIIRDRLVRVHESNNFFALAWSEVWYAYEFGIRARLCPYCLKVFLVPANNPHQSTCLSKECKRRHLIERHGGIDEYRAWERNRKKIGGSGVRGRPRKKSE